MFPDPLRRSARLHPSKPAIVTPAARLSYGDADARANRLAHALTGLGLARGDRVAVLLENGPAWWEVVFGIARAGLCAVPVNTHLAPGEIDGILGDCSASALLHDAASDGLAASLAAPPRRIRLGAGEGEALDYEALLAASSPAPADAPVDEADDALIVYTSGTTGRPKGVVLSHRAMRANGLSQALAHGLRHDDRFLTSTPLYHLAGGARIQALSLVGGTHLVLPAFDPEALLRFAEEERATSTLLVATMARKLLDELERGGVDLGSWRTVCHGAAPTPYEVLARMCELLPAEHYVGWGLTEGGTFLTVLSPWDYLGPDGRPTERLGSVGREAVNARVDLVDEDGGPVTEPGERGRLAVTSDRMMTRYWNLPDATGAVLREGRLLTDDVAYADDEGFLYVVDRRTDMIVSGGVNIYPREIEKALETHPGVAEVAVIGVPDDVWGEAPLAVVVPRAPGAADEVALEQHARGLLGSFKVPRRYVFADSLPRNAVGKVAKEELRRAYWQGRERQVN